MVLSGFYAWLNRPLSPRAQEDATLARLIRQIFNLYDGVYGSPRIAYEVRALGHRVSESRVARLMAHMGLRAVQTKAFKVATTVSNQDHPVAPDLLQQDFSANRPNQKWVGDVTSIATKEGWVYLATVIDLYSRKVVGWSLSDSLATPLVNDALEMAVRSRRPDPGTIFHSDRGCQYTSVDYRQRLADHGLLASMSRNGCCYDNAVAESFFHSLKVEWIRGNVSGVAGSGCGPLPVRTLSAPSARQVSVAAPGRRSGDRRSRRRCGSRLHRRPPPWRVGACCARR